MQLYPHATYEISRDGMTYPSSWETDNNLCPPHYHSALELVYQRSGTMHAMLDGAETELLPGQLLVVPSYAIHTFRSQLPATGIVTVLPTDYIPALQKKLGGQSLAGGIFDAGSFVDEAAHHMARLAAMPSPPARDSFAMRGNVYLLLDLLLQNVPLVPRQASSDVRLMREVLAYLNANYTAPISQERVAHLFGYSAGRFSRLFNQSIGCSLPDYINMLRAREAARSLREQDISVTEAALAAGFESSRTFYRAFKQSFGMTATEFVKEHRAGR